MRQESNAGETWKDKGQSLKEEACPCESIILVHVPEV